MGHIARAGANATTQPAANPAEICEYLAELALEMRTLCKQHHLSHLAYLMEIVYVEATEQAISLKTSPPQSTDK